MYFSEAGTSDVAFVPLMVPNDIVKRKLWLDVFLLNLVTVGLPMGFSTSALPKPNEVFASGVQGQWRLFRKARSFGFAGQWKSPETSALP